MASIVIVNGVTYKEIKMADLTIYDGGVHGGKIKRLPNGVYQDEDGQQCPTFSEAANHSLKSMERKYKEARDFVIKYERALR